MKIAQVLIYCNCPHRLSLQYLSPPYPPPTALPTSSTRPSPSFWEEPPNCECWWDDDDAGTQLAPKTPSPSHRIERRNLVPLTSHFTPPSCPSSSTALHGIPPCISTQTHRRTDGLTCRHSSYLLPLTDDLANIIREGHQASPDTKTRLLVVVSGKARQATAPQGR